VLLRKIAIGLILGAACGGTPARTGATSPPQSPSPAPPSASRTAAATSDPDVPAGADASRDAELAKRFEPFIDAFTNSGGILSPDGKRVVFISNRDGLPQLYVANAGKPEAPATRLVATPERVVEFMITADGKYVVFQTDKGADENFTFWRVGLDGQDLAEITPGETLNRDAPRRADKVPGAVYYSARKKEEAASGAYSVPLAGGAPKKLHASDGLGRLVDVAPDGKTLLYRRILSYNDNHLDVVDVASGKAREVYPGAGGTKVSIGDAVLSADGKSALVVTDTGGERRVLLALDLRTGKERRRYTDPEAIASLTACSRGGNRNRLACGVSIGNRSDVRVFDAAKLEPIVDVKLPLGSGGPSWFADDGRTVLVSWSTPNNPTDIYLVSATTGQVAPLRREDRPSIASLPPLQVVNAEVTAHDSLKIPVHAYLPPKAVGGKKVPVIVNYHGGPQQVSAIRWSPYTRFFCSLGYAWVEPNVRGSSAYGRAFAMADDGPKRVEALKDIETIGRWVAEQPWADKDRLVILGRSYGGYTTLIGLTRQPTLWRAGVDVFGIANWVTFMKSTNRALRELFLTEIGDPEKDLALLESLSPIKDVNKIRVPLFVYAGANDPRVPRTESDQIVKAVRERGLAVEYMVAPNEGHSLDRRDNQIACTSRIARFLEKALGR
jgi:dipeptidyl aminopeptidase/acylaminoacyl peptidase